MPGVEEFPKPEAQPQGKRLLSVEEAAKRLGLSKARVYRFCRAEPSHPLFMPHIRLGKDIRIPEEALDFWVKRATVGQLWHAEEFSALMSGVRQARAAEVRTVQAREPYSKTLQKEVDRIIERQKRLGK